MNKELYVYRIYEACDESEKSYNYGIFDSEVNRKLIDSGYVFAENRDEFKSIIKETYPNINFIGLEVNDSQMVNAINRLQKENLKNLKLINIDANEVVSIFGKEIDTIYLTFCDPWPKKIDERRRFTHESFLKLYDRIFKKNKHIILKTDNKGFFAYSLETLSGYWYTFERVSLDLHHDEYPIKNIMTNYEKQYFKEGRPIYYLDAKFEG